MFDDNWLKTEEVVATRSDQTIKVLNSSINVQITTPIKYDMRHVVQLYAKSLMKIR